MESMKKSDRTGSKLPAAGSLAAAVLLWLLASEARLVPSFLLPSPAAVCRALAEDAPVLLENAGVTLLEAALGLAAGILSALVLATLMHHVPVLYRALYPILVITQTIPTVALAPLLVLWMGFGMAPKVTLVALLRSMGAGRRQIFRYLEFPSALSHFFSGLRVSASYAVVGAVISEWLGGFQGLGVYMIRVKKAYAFDKMFAVILVIVAVSLLLMGLVTALRRRACPWEAFEKIERND